MDIGRSGNSAGRRCFSTHLSDDHPVELQFILQDAAVKLVFIGDEKLARKVAGIHRNLPDLQAIFTFDQVSDVRHWRELLVELTPKLETQLAKRQQSLTPADLATILYTSGTTGTPKGVMLSHQNILSNVFSSSILLGRSVFRAKKY